MNAKLIFGMILAGLAKAVNGIVLHENKNMLAFGKKLGFEIRKASDSGENELVIHLGGNGP